MRQDEPLVGCREAAAILGVHVATVKRWAAEGVLPAKGKLGGTRGAYVLGLADVEALAARRSEPETAA